MTTIEHTPETGRPGSERPIFLAENGRRARVLGIAAKVAVMVTVLWLAALAAGMLGFGHLPGTSIEQPFNRLISGGDDATKNQAPPTDSASVTASARERAARAQAIVARRSTPAGAGTSASRPRPVRRATTPAAPAQPAPPATGPSAVAQQPRQQGWTRRGYVAPPGRVRQAEPPAPTPQPGNGYGRVKKTTPITPPPPPPPPPGNGNGNGGLKLK